MYIPPFFEIAQNFLFFFSLLSTASAQGLTDAQIELVKQRLQEGATPSAKVQKVGKGLARQRWSLPRQSYDYTGRGSTYTRAYKASTTLPLFETFADVIGQYVPLSLYTSFVETLCCCGDLGLLVFSNTRLLRWLRTFIFSNQIV